MELEQAIEGLPVVYSTPRIVFYWNGQKNLLISVAKTYSDEQEYRANMQACLDISSQKKINYLIFESSNFKGTTPENQKWVSEYLAPNFNNIGIKAISLVMANDMDGKVSLNSMVQKTPLFLNQIPLQFTDSFEDAYDWIMEQVLLFE